MLLARFCRGYNAPWASRLRSTAGVMPFGNYNPESQRDSIIQPRVATKELPWVDAPTMIYPNGVASSQRFSVTLNFRKALVLRLMPFGNSNTQSQRDSI